MNNRYLIAARFIFALLLVVFLTGCPNPSDDQAEWSGALIVRALTDLPAATADNEGKLYFVIDEDQFYYSDGSAYIPIDLTGPQGPSGSSIEWLGSLPAHPADPQLNWAYYNSIDRCAYIWDGDSWQVLARDGEGAISVNAHGFVDPGDYLALQHNLDRDDLTFTGQFVLNGLIYDQGDYRPLFGGPVVSQSVAPTVFQGAECMYISATGLTNGDLAVAYRDQEDSGYGKLAIYDDEGNQIVATTVFESAYTEYVSATTLASGDMAIAYRDNGNSYYGTIVIYDDEGNEVLEPTVFAGSTTSYVSATSLANGRFAVAYQDAGNSGYGTLVIYDDEGNEVLAPTVFCSGSTTYVSATSLANGGFVIAYRDSSSSNYGIFQIFDDEGNQVVTPTVFNNYTGGEVISASLVNGGFVIAYRDQYNNNYGTFVIHDDEGYQVAGPKVFEYANAAYISVTGLANGDFAVAYSDGGNLIFGTLVIYDDDGTEAVGPTVFNRAWSTYVSAATLANGDLAIAYCDNSIVPKRGTIQTFTTADLHLSLERVDSNEVRLWNHADQTLEMMLSVN